MLLSLLPASKDNEFYSELVMMLTEARGKAVLLCLLLVFAFLYGDFDLAFEGVKNFYSVF